jgi:hypothetical protein
MFVMTGDTMATKRTTYRLTDRDLERVRQIRTRYRLGSDTDAVRLALVLVLRQNVVYGDTKIREMLE